MAWVILQQRMEPLAEAAHALGATYVTLPAMPAGMRKTGAGHACPRRLAAPALRRCYLKLAVRVIPKVRGAPNA
jgi:hypothetical protein